MSESVIRAVNELRSGKLVAIPTETVYGLGADASNPLAIQRVYELKGRPTDHPLIVHVQAPLDHSQDKARDWLDILSPWVRHIPESAFTLFEHFWPGPLTLVFQKSRMVLKDVTGGQETIAIRSPSHPLAQELLRVFAGGIAAPSANRFGKISPSSAAHVRSEFKHHPDLMILDGGDCQFGIESTILDVSGNGQPCLLRPGSISPTQIKFVFQSIELLSKLVEGKFPDYQRVIPKDHQNAVTINRENFLSALQRVAILTTDKFKGIRCSLKQNHLLVQSTNAEQEEAQEEIETTYIGDDIDIGFNVTYLLDVLTNVKNSEIKISIGDSNSSALITIPENDNFKYVVMPMRI